MSNSVLHLFTFLCHIYAPLYCSFAEKDLMLCIRSFSVKSTLRVGEILLCSVKYAFGV